MPPRVLPKELALQAITAEDLGPLQARWPASLRLDSDRGTDYNYLPYLLLPALGGLTATDLRPVALFTRLLAGSILLQDELADGDTPRGQEGLAALRMMAMQFEAWQQLTPHIPPGARFWERTQELLAEHARASLEEQRFSSGERPWSEYSEQLGLRLIVGKNGVSRAVVAALVELARAEHLYAPLVEALDAFNIATQLCDDLKDWKADLRLGLPSLLLVRFVPSRPAAPPSQSDLERLGREMYYGGHASHVLRLAIQHLEEAERRPRALVEEMPWYPFVSELRGKCQGMLEDVERIVEENKRRVRGQPRLRVELPPATGPWQQLAWSALGFLLRQWELGFGEARDVIKYPPTLGFQVGPGAQYGDVFQRALAVEMMCDANEALSGRLQPVLEHEARYLLDCRLKHGFGGWSYFPNLLDLPPDVDDLAQVMTSLLRSGFRQQVVSTCEPVLEVALRDGALPDGSYETWIVPAQGRTPLQERHADLVKRVWGAGSDADVMANLIDALRRYEPVRFAQVIERGLDFLEAQQLEVGHWSSRWYRRPWYGVYACLRALLWLRPRSAAVSRALGLVRGWQRPEGGWGMEGQPCDALSTALAVVTLAWAREHGLGEEEDLARAERARARLESLRQEDGSWPAQELIHVGLGVYHGSRTVTTACVLRAALAWERHTRP